MKVDDNAEKIIDTISTNLINGKKAESDLEKMVSKLCTINASNFIGLKEYVHYRNKIVEYIQGFYV